MPVVSAAAALHPRPVWAGRGGDDLVIGNHLSAAATRVESHARMLRLVRLTDATPIRSTLLWWTRQNASQHLGVLAGCCICRLCRRLANKPIVTPAQRVRLSTTKLNSR